MRTSGRKVDLGEESGPGNGWALAPAAGTAGYGLSRFAKSRRAPPHTHTGTIMPNHDWLPPRTNTAIIARIFNYSAPRNVVGSCSMCFDPSNPPRALFFFYNPPRAPFFFFSLLAALQLHTRRPHPRPPTPPDTAAHKGQSQPPSGRVAESRPYIVRLRTLIAFLSTRGR